MERKHGYTHGNEDTKGNSKPNNDTQTREQQDGHGKQKGQKKRTRRQLENIRPDKKHGIGDGQADEGLDGQARRQV